MRLAPHVHRFSRLGAVLAGLIALLGVTVAFADATAPAVPQSAASASLQSTEGKVISTSASRLVIETDTGSRMTFTLDAATAEPASLAAGDRVTVRYSEAAASGAHADAVTLAAAPPSVAVANATPSVAVANATPGAAVPNATPGAAIATAPAPATPDLPRTASRLPLILLVGTLAGLVAFGVHLSREERL